MTGEGIIIQHMLYLFSQSVEGFTHIGNAGNEPDTGTGKCCVRHNRNGEKNGDANQAEKGVSAVTEG